MSDWGKSNKGKTYEEVITSLHERVTELERIISIISPDSVKYPALAAAYKEYKIIEKLTLGNEK